MFNTAMFANAILFAQTKEKKIIFFFFYSNRRHFGFLDPDNELQRNSELKYIGNLAALDAYTKFFERIKIDVTFIS